MSPESLCVKHPDRKVISFCHHCQDRLCFECAVEGKEHYYCHKTECQEVMRVEGEKTTEEKPNDFLAAFRNDANLCTYLISLAGTLGLTAVYLALRYLPLPTAEPLLESYGKERGMYLSVLNIMDVNLDPVIAAFCFTEILSLALKPLRRWRLEGTAGREKINRVAWGMVLGFTFFQAMGTSYYVKNLDGADPPFLFPSPGFLYHLINVAALMGGTFLAVWLAQLVNRLGIGNGYLILTLGVWFEAIFRRVAKEIRYLWKSNPAPYEMFSLALMAGLFAFCIFMIWKFIQRTPRIPIRYGEGKRLWFEISPFPQSIGVHNFALSLVALFGTIAAYQAQITNVDWSGPLKHGWLHFVLVAVFTVLSGYVLCGLFYGKIDLFGLSVANLAEKVVKREKVIDRQFWKATVFLLALAFVFWATLELKSPIFPFWIVQLGVLIQISAVLQDLYAQWTFWRAHGKGVELMEMDNVHLAAYLKGLFEAEGLAFHIQTYGFRRLFFIFSPLNKMKLLVSADQVEKAQTLLETVPFKVA